ncbi:hypothetical protein TWF106_001312 [Orbilia oligospora]|uniref:Pentatricopeptide repeat domain-containing protein n=1 Tax=Orbilia oligospora TaxID=2813651 RepID=A0A7C8QTQ9_ORBOL|nr:hypothetical protein TWF679_006519 [Orbilia oligospora]KAF3226097.1 hypothetical protein TWF106_001312 [Orbilia oligospora]
MRRFADRLVRSSWGFYNGPTELTPPSSVRHLSTAKAIVLVPDTKDAIKIVSYRSRKIGRPQLSLGLHYSQGTEGKRPKIQIPAWLNPESWLAKEPQDVIYGDDRDLDNLPPVPKKREYWMDAQYPTGIVKQEKRQKKKKKRQKQKTDIIQKPGDLSLQSSSPLEPERPRNYLSNRPITSKQVYTRLFGKESRPFHDFMREARVERQFTLGRLMVDTAEIRNYHEYWLQLLKFRARIHGEKGVKDIWIGLSMRMADIPLTGPVADEMWRFFVKVGLEDEDFLLRLYKYLRQRFERRGQLRWRPMYNTVVGGLLSKKPLRALWWHYHMVDMAPPRGFTTFFQQHATDPKNIQTLFKIFKSKKIGPVYEAAIPFLCRMEYYEIAVQWHKMLMSKGDKPTDSHHADRLMEYYAFHKPLKDLEMMLREFKEHGIEVMESTVITLIKARYRTRAIMDLLCELYTAKVICKDCFGDRFWAFLLTYQRFSEADVTAYMKKLGIERIARETTKEFVKRGKTTADFIRGIALLNRRKIPIDNDVYSKFLEVKARWNPEEALEESLPIEDLEITRGNALLQGYLSTYRWKFFNHVYKNLRRRNAVTWNLFLKRLFMTRQLKTGLELMEEMRALSIPIRSSAQSELLHAILLPRRSSHRPITQDPRARRTKDLRIATNYLRALLMNGDRVDPRLWREIIKRYGMFRKLKDLEKLCLWLADWYDPRRPALRQASIPIKFTDVGQIASLGYDRAQHVEWTDPPLAESNRSPKNPLRILFPATTIRSIIEYGFLSMQRSWYLGLLRRRSRIELKARLSRCAWGIRLVKQLQERGVWVDERSVSRAVRVRLRALEGSKYHWESFDTNMSKHEPINLGVMASIAEKAWGKELFPKGSWDTEEGLMRMLKAPVKDIVLPRRLRMGRRP